MEQYTGLCATFLFPQINYHIACKNEKTAVNQERNATKDSSLSQDQVGGRGKRRSTNRNKYTVSV